MGFFLVQVQAVGSIAKSIAEQNIAFAVLVLVVLGLCFAVVKLWTENNKIKDRLFDTSKDLLLVLEGIKQQRKSTDDKMTSDHNIILQSINRLETEIRSK